MFGFGALKQMNDTFKYNRDLLGKKKAALERQRDEIRVRPSTYENVNLDYVKARISAKLKRNKTQEMISAFVAVFFLLTIIGGVIWIALSIDFSRKNEPSTSRAFFHTITYKQSNGLYLRTEYFVGGPKASETMIKDGMKHQNSESFYETGEQFRSALYYYDTLVREVYFYKTGDTIKGFPVVPDTVVAHITLRYAKRHKKIEFDFIDGKIVGATYQETQLRN
jgi:hypothetical protein